MLYMHMYLFWAMPTRGYTHLSLNNPEKLNHVIISFSKSDSILQKAEIILYQIIHGCLLGGGEIGSKDKHILAS